MTVTPSVQNTESDEADEAVNRLINNTGSPASQSAQSASIEELTDNREDQDEINKGGKPTKKRVRQPANGKSASSSAKKPANKRLDKSATDAMRVDVELVASQEQASIVDPETPSVSQQSLDENGEVAAGGIRKVLSNAECDVAITSKESDVATPSTKRQRVSKASTKKLESAEVDAMEIDHSASASIENMPSSSALSSEATKPASHKKAKKELSVTFDELAPETQAKIQLYKQKTENALVELLLEESDYCDKDVEVDSAIADLVDMIRTADTYVAADVAAEVANVDAESEKQSAEPTNIQSNMADHAAELEICDVTDDTPLNSAKDADNKLIANKVTLEMPEFRLDMAIKKIIARTMQGSSDSMSRLSISISVSLGRAVEQVEQAFRTTSNEQLSELSNYYLDNAKKSLQTLRDDSNTLEDVIKNMGSRESYGQKEKNSVMFEDTNTSALWRWDVVKDAARFFTKSSINVAREFKSSYRRYGALIKAYSKVIEELSRSVTADEAKVVKLDEAVAKAVSEIAKAKEKRVVEEQKKKALSAEKAKKEVEKEQKKKQVEQEKDEKRKAKEAEALKKKEESAKAKLEAKTEAQREKDRIKEEEEAKLSKQKNLMLNMFAASKPAVPKSTTTSASFLRTPSSAVKASAPTCSLVDLTVNSRDDRSTIQSNGDCIPNTATHMTEFDTDAFIATMNAGMTMQECLIKRSNQISSIVRQDYLKTAEPRYPSKLTVVLAAAPVGFGQEGYAESAEVHVDGFMRTFSFADDHKRPAYFGTRSKVSAIISGRRPFEHDHNMVNYDYDSEDEYDEEADGEDIMESDGEDEEGGNDLEFDEFFRHDNDFGSDADSDGEMMAAVIMRSRPGEEKVGLRFLRDENGQWQQRGNGWATAGRIMQAPGMKAILDESADHPTAALANCFESEKDVVRLRNYGCVVFANARSMPFLGWTESQPKKAVKAEVPDNEEDVDNSAQSAKREAKAPKEPKAKPEPKPVVPKHMDEALLPALVKHIHGRCEGAEKIVAEFCTAHPTEAKAKVERKMKEIANKKKSDEGYGTARWVVNKSVIDSIGLTVGTSVEGSEESFDLPNLAFTPPKVKRQRPQKEKDTEDLPAPKSARLRRDNSNVVKPLGSEWWPDNENPVEDTEACNDSEPKAEAAQQDETSVEEQQEM